MVWMSGNSTLRPPTTERGLHGRLLQFLAASECMSFHAGNVDHYFDILGKKCASIRSMFATRAMLPSLELKEAKLASLTRRFRVTFSGLQGNRTVQLQSPAAITAASSPRRNKCFMRLT